MADSPDLPDPIYVGDDPFDVEVTDLRTGAAVRRPFARNASSSKAGLRGSVRGESDEEDESDGLELELPRRSSSHRRQRAAIVTGIVLAAVILVVLFNPTANLGLYTVFRFPTPVPSPTPLPGGNLVYLVRGAPWGSVTLDGKTTQFANLGMRLAWLRLTPGRHTVVVNQSPFPTLKCVISAPASVSDSCPLLSAYTFDTPEFGGGPTDLPEGSRIVNLGARFSMLPLASQNALVAAISAYLNPPATSLTLQPGDHYLRDDGSPAVAQTMLRATFIPTMLPPAGGVASDNPSCVSFCDLSGVGMSSGGSWDIQVALLGSWRITTAGGQVIAEHAPMYPDANMYADIPPALQIAFSLLWTGDWQVSLRSDSGFGVSPACEMALRMMSAHFNSTPQVPVTGMGEQAGRTPEQGCVLTAFLADPTQSDPIYLYYHLGMLLAANDAAHRAIPTLTVASAAERALALQILTEPYNP